MAAQLADLRSALGRLLLGAALLFAILVGLRVHGFSLPVWHELLGVGEQSGLLWGEPQAIRADDFAVHIPLLLAQSAHDPPFPTVNTNIGRGQNALVPIPIPVAHAASLFRPTLWGFFLDDDVGLAWMWWSRALGLLTVWLGVFLVVSEGRLALSLGGSLLLLFAPFFQFWSLNAAGLTAYAGLGFLAACTLATASRAGAILAAGVVLGWAGGCFLLALYPPYQLALGLVLLVVFGGFLAGEGRLLRLRRRAALRGIGLALALLVMGGAIWALLAGAGDAIAVLRGTAYPGDRPLATGGGVKAWQLLNADLWLPLQVSDYGPLGNICEAASFWLLSPLVVGALLVRLLSGGGRPDALTAGLALCVIVFWGYALVGVPEVVARATPLGQVPAERAILGLGVADALLLVRFLARRPASGPSATTLGLAALWTLALAGCAFRLHSSLPDTSPLLLSAAILVNAVLAVLVLGGWRPARLVAAMAGVLFVCTAWFNPVVSGGTRTLRDAPLARKILELDRQGSGESVWLSYHNTYLPNLPRMLGVRALDGAQAVPQLGLWETLDATPGARHVYNRYAHVTFRLPRSGEPTFSLTSHDGFAVSLDPEGGGLARLGATHLLVRASPGSRRSSYWGRFEPLDQIGPDTIFELPLRRRQP